MSPEYMVLGLPDDVDADEDVIRDGADGLLTTRNTMLGQSIDLETSFWATANEFSDTIAWDITGASGQQIQTWEATAELLTHGAGTLTLYADAVKEYRGVRADLHLRWSECKSAALARIGEFGADTLTFSGVSQEQAEVDYLNGVREELLGEHAQARSDLDDATDDTKDALTNGPSAASWKRIEDAGLMTGREIHIFGGVPDPVIDFGPQEDWTPQEVARWWADLAPNQREHAMEEYPDDLRNLDGVPVVVRDELNRTAFEEHLELMEDKDPALEGVYLKEIREALEEEDTFLIYFDPLSLDGQAALSRGNPDTADNVSTLVPGMLNHLGSLGTSIERADTILAEMDENAPGADNASVVWFGYDPPFPGDMSADDAGRDFAEFQEGLRATHQGDEPSHNTVIGHSFGALVVGAADNPNIGGGLAADSMVLIGGAGATVDNISELSMSEEDVHVVLGDDDWISTARGLGMDGSYGVPLHEEEFYQDPDNPGQDLGNRLDPSEETGHSGYFDDEQTLDYLGDVTTGK
ncbi:alpha/beta hydrolase [Nocardiopsis sp. FR6]|uniref:alpha/beta hydrolase n=1 Tax=Nocardiopsis sp. FR6 TaxID=2605986 RepID=UPI001359699C|nr:alpha/beta hydrolase [Nocardiopsis sp. FR6]